MLTKRQFISLYDEAVLGIRQIKNYNDKLNKNLGVTNELALLKETEAESQIVEITNAKIQELIKKMQKSYLDPDTARKIGVVKQQLRMQRDRRGQLVQNLVQAAKHIKIEQQRNHTRKNTHKPEPNYRKAEKTTQMQIPTPVNHWNKRSQLTDIEESTEGSQVMMEISDFDYEIERKLMQDKRQRLGQAHEKLVNVKNLMTETSSMVYEQGEKLDIIGDQLFSSYKNVSMAVDELDEANQNHKKSRKRIITFSMLLLLIVGAAVTVLFVI